MVVVPIFNKWCWRYGTITEGIILLSLPGKVCARVLGRRVRKLVKPWLQEEQYGFLS